MSLLIKRLFGFECETNSFIENLNKSNSLKNLIPELVEKKEPPIDAKKWEGVENKFKDHFSEKAGN